MERGRQRRKGGEYWKEVKRGLTSSRTGKNVLGAYAVMVEGEHSGQGGIPLEE